MYLVENDALTVGCVYEYECNEIHAVFVVLAADARPMLGPPYAWVFVLAAENTHFEAGQLRYLWVTNPVFRKSVRVG